MKEQLPTGWIQTCLGEVCLPVSKHQPNNQPDKEIAYLDIGGIDSQTHSISEIKRYLGAEAPSRARQLVQTGDTLFSTVRVYLEKIALVSDPLNGSTASTGFCVLRPSGAINPSFLYFRVLEHGFIEELSTKQTGTSYPAVRDQDIFAMSIHLPPLAEQRKITDAIEEHFSHIVAVESAAQTALVKLDTLRRTVLTAAFSGRLVGQNPDDEPASILLEQIAAEPPQRQTRHAQSANQVPSSVSTQLPPGWEQVTIGNISTFIRGVTFKKSDASSEPSFGLVPIARAGNIEPGRAKLEQDLIYVSENRVAINQYLRSGDILIATSSGSPEVVGKSAIIAEHWQGAHGAFMGVIRSNSSIYPTYLGFYVQSDIVRHIWRELAAGTNINNLKKDHINSTIVPLPPMAEQKRIIAAIEEHLSRIDTAKALLERCLQRCGVLRRSILAAAFSGRLVDQDPDDEPASVLLERIAAEQPKRRTRRKSA